MNRATEIVAIDGPAGAGKSTVARRVADVLGFAYLDTGAMYRAATWWAMHQGIDLDDPAATAAATRSMPLMLREEDGVLEVLVDGRDVSDEIRSPEVTRHIHRLDCHAQVRERLVELQRRFAAQQPTVAEGRDIGTVVFPHAKCKVFLDAALDERARRRAAQLAGKGVAVELDEVRDEIDERDRRNTTRAVAPLRRAEDAVLIDSTSMTLEEVVNAIVRLARDAP
jgi:cytidylate kinase